MLKSGTLVFVVAAAMVAAAVPAAQADAATRTTSMAYVAELTVDCHHAGASALLASYVGQVPGAPDPQDALGESPCFPVEPGETHARISVRDSIAPRVSYWVGVRAPDAGWVVSSTHCSDEPAEVALPEGATRVAVIVQAATVGYCEGNDPALVWGAYESAAYATTGTVTVTFS